MSFNPNQWKAAGGEVFTAWEVTAGIKPSTLEILMQYSWSSGEDWTLHCGSVRHLYSFGQQWFIFGFSHFMGFVDIKNKNNECCSSLRQPELKRFTCFLCCIFTKRKRICICIYNTREKISDSLTVWCISTFKILLCTTFFFLFKHTKLISQWLEIHHKHTKWLLPSLTAAERDFDSQWRRKVRMAGANYELRIETLRVLLAPSLSLT